jgi:hypothetical protein
MFSCTSSGYTLPQQSTTTTTTTTTNNLFDTYDKGYNFNLIYKELSL